MNLKQFLLTNRKNKRGETNLWPPIGDLGLVICGSLMWFLINDYTAYLGLGSMIIGLICFGISLIQHERQNLREVKK